MGDGDSKAAVGVGISPLVLGHSPSLDGVYGTEINVRVVAEQEETGESHGVNLSYARKGAPWVLCPFIGTLGYSWAKVLTFGKDKRGKDIKIGQLMGTVEALVDVDSRGTGALGLRDKIGVAVPVWDFNNGHRIDMIVSGFLDMQFVKSWKGNFDLGGGAAVVFEWSYRSPD